MNEEKIAKLVERFDKSKKLDIILGVGFWSAIILGTVNLLN